MSAEAQSLYFPLDGNTAETATSAQCTMNGVRTLPYAQGVKGQAVRFDGYSNYISGTPSYAAVTPASMTFSVWLAPETYPMMDAGSAQVVPTYAMVAGNLDASAKTGFGLFLNSQGGYQFAAMIDNDRWDYTISDDIIPLGQWSNIVVTMDNASGNLCVYRNGKSVKIAEGSFYETMTMGTASFIIGKSRDELKSGLFNINTFNGLIDEVRVDNGVKTAAAVASDYASAIIPTDLSIPVTSLLGLSANGEGGAESDYGYLRPQFHGMPAKGWTNESHGMVYYNGKYHVFFQKNGNGPYMARLHWGHITSTDLINWTEEPVAIAPGASANNLEANDGKGCWSGCVFTDPDFNDGKPTILYTGVSNAKAYIWMAKPLDDNLLTWEKTPGQIIDSEGNPCCSDASDDFRDPYFFTANGNKYIIIGTSNTSKVGTCLLYKYNGSSWVRQGLFFSGTSQASCGRFWEMPNVTDLGNGKYLFTCTPLETSTGVKTLYWIGTIGADGKFTPEQKDPLTFEAEETSRDGYGMLSPTIYNKDGKLLALGIVPDKVATDVNYNWGWAHNYSLPRELTVGTDPFYGTTVLVEKPLSALSDFRNGETTGGRQIEMTGSFTHSSDKQGFRFLKSGDNYAELYVQGDYLCLDLTHMQRTVNDDVYGGIYKTPLYGENGETMTVDAILDGSIIDIFFSTSGIAGGAFSVRLFPTDSSATGAEAFGNGTTHIYTIAAGKPTAINQMVDGETSDTSVRKCIIDGMLCIVKNDKVYSVSGARLK